MSMPAVIGKAEHNIALYLETDYEKLHEVFFQIGHPHASFNSHLVLTRDKSHWQYNYRHPIFGIVRHSINLDQWHTNDGADIWVKYVKEVDTYFIWDDRGALREFLMWADEEIEE